METKLLVDHTILCRHWGRQWGHLRAYLAWCSSLRGVFCLTGEQSIRWMFLVSGYYAEVRDVKETDSIERIVCIIPR